MGAGAASAALQTSAELVRPWLEGFRVLGFRVIGFRDQVGVRLKHVFGGFLSISEYLCSFPWLLVSVYFGFHLPILPIKALLPTKLATSIGDDEALPYKVGNTGLYNCYCIC